MPQSPSRIQEDGDETRLAPILSFETASNAESDLTVNVMPSTPENDDEFLATLFPHPIRAEYSIIPPPTSLFSINPYLRTDEDRSLFNHYLHVVSRALSRTHDSDSNPFLITLLPMAAMSEIVTSVILSLSGCHWKRVYPGIWRRALRRQGEGTIQITSLLMLNKF